MSYKLFTQWSKKYAVIPSGIIMTIVTDIPITIGASCQKWLTMWFCDVWIMHSTASSKVYTERCQKKINSKYITSGDHIQKGDNNLKQNLMTTDHFITDTRNFKKATALVAFSWLQWTIIGVLCINMHTCNLEHACNTLFLRVKAFQIK